jgi:hypothetical protein
VGRKERRKEGRKKGRKRDGEIERKERAGRGRRNVEGKRSIRVRKEGRQSNTKSGVSLISRNDLL